MWRGKPDGPCDVGLETHYFIDFIYIYTYIYAFAMVYMVYGLNV